MAIAFPRDILADFPGWTTKFEPQYRQERSRTASGNTIAKDFGSPIWKGSYKSRRMRPNELDKWRAILMSLDGGVNTFLGYSLSRCYPIAYPRGSWPTGGAFNGKTAVVSAINPDNKTVNVSGLPALFKFSTGDMLQIGDTDLYRVMNDVVASGVGLATGVELRPHLWPATTVGALVSVRQPHCIMSVDPDSVNSDADPETGAGSITFDAWEAR